MQRASKLGFQCYRCCNVSVSVLSSVRASLLRSSIARVPHRAVENVPHLPFPALTLSGEAGFPQAKPCPASLPTTIPGCLFLFPMQEASTLAESGENSNKHHLEALSFMSITCRLPAAKRVWHSCFPQSSKSLLCICRSNV